MTVQTPTTATLDLVRPATVGPGWWQRHWKWAVPLGAGVLLFVGVACVVGLLSLVFGLLRGSEVYRTALATARAEPKVVAALGTPIDDGLFVSGNMEVTPTSGMADLAIPIEGPRGDAVLYVQARKQSGRWTYQTMTVDAGTGSIDLLAGR